MVVAFAPTGMPRFAYDAARTRTVILPVAAMLESLRRIYHANGIVSEIVGRPPAA